MPQIKRFSASSFPIRRSRRGLRASRRDFLKFMAASLALGGVGAVLISPPNRDRPLCGSTFGRRLFQVNASMAIVPGGGAVDRPRSATRLFGSGCAGRHPFFGAVFRGGREPHSGSAPRCRPARCALQVASGRDRKASTPRPGQRCLLPPSSRDVPDFTKLISAPCGF